MKRSLQASLIGALAVICAGAGFLLYQWQSGGESQPAPAASGQILLKAQWVGLDGSTQSLERWRGKVLVVNFWATWCAPCREEIPGFVKFQEEYAARGVQFVGIAIDVPERVGPYAREIGINYPVLIGGIETMDLARQVGNRAGVLPFTVVINRDGTAVTAVTGVLSPVKLQNLLNPLL